MWGKVILHGQYIILNDVEVGSQLKQQQSQSSQKQSKAQQKKEKLA